ncbi:RNA binding protein, heterogenous nuclear RNP-K like protein [Chytriomyces hyalinus]|nr:RNA binding protein, heterogenous nuclear RNP-K like protein [Chytriomyces hyalinus]
MNNDSLARLTGLSLNPDTPPNNQDTDTDAVMALPVSNTTHSTVIADNAEPSSPTDSTPQVTLRALVSTKEAGVVIGHGGKNVADIRDETGVKAGVSKVIPGVTERILTITGSFVGVAKAFAMIAKLLVDSPVSQTSPQQFPDCTTIRLLVSHHLIGSVIGKSGSKIKQIQEDSGAKLVVSKDMLHQSTERVVDILGLVKSIEVAVFNLASCIYNDGKPVVGVIPYQPQAQSSIQPRSNNSNSNTRSGRFDETGTQNTNSRNGNSHNSSSNNRNNSNDRSNGNSRPNTTVTSDEPQTTQTLAVPSDMVGCIIGKGGSFIANIRRQSNAKLRISELEEGGSNERVVTIVGSASSIAKALQLIYEQLEAEKSRRLNGGVGGRRVDGDN